jgi:putative Holliday junction resolvase
MRYLGIDFGLKHVGIAVSDETNSFAFPLVVLNNSNNLIEKLFEICKQNNITEIVVGESRNFDQKENKIMEEIIPFVKNLKDYLDLPVHMHPEFLTSEEAERLQGKNDMNDASAAALILKSYLDLKNNTN